MKPFSVVAGVAAALPAANIDTDIIMPKQFLKGVDRAGLDIGAFHDLRFDPAGTSRPDFVLNKAPWRETRFLIVGPNFGCGSSREHAVWGMCQLGIRALIGTSFAGIFFDNCARNGLLAISLTPEDVDRLLALAGNAESNAMTINLEDQTVETSDGSTIAFDIEPSRKNALLLGLDAVGTTLQGRDAIAGFERAYLEANPWLG